MYITKDGTLLVKQDVTELVMLQLSTKPYQLQVKNIISIGYRYINKIFMSPFSKIMIISNGEDLTFVDIEGQFL